MTVFVARADARLLPCRRRFALFRLAAYLRSRTAHLPDDPAKLYFLDRDQTSLEQYSVAIWATITTSALFAGYLETVWPVWVALACAIPFAALSLQLPIVLIGSTVLPWWERLTGRPVQRIRFHSRVTMSMIGIGAFAACQSTRWPRLVGWQFFALAGANAAAAMLLWVLRADVRRIEQERGAA